MGEDRTVNLAAWKKAAPEPAMPAAADLSIEPIRTEPADPGQLPGSFGGVRPHDVVPRIDEVDARV